MPSEDIGPFLGPYWSEVADIFRQGVSSKDVLDFGNSDFPHSEFHRKQVSIYSSWMALELGLGKPEAKTCIYAGTYHDSGLLLARRKGLELGKHQMASLVVAYLTTDDLFDFGVSSLRDLSEAIALHSEDVLPEDAALTTRIVRDCDRVAGMGWTGIVRSAYYLGFRHPSFTKKPQEAVAEDFSLVDMNSPWVDGYETNVRKFVLENVLPFIKDKGKSHEILYHCLVWSGRFEGMWSKQKHSWAVEPILDKIQGWFLRKHLATLEFIAILVRGTPAPQVKKVLKRIEREYPGFSTKDWIKHLLSYTLEPARKRGMLWD